MEEEVVEVKGELYNLQKELLLAKVGTVEWLSSDDKVRFYTSFPNFKVLDSLFKFIQLEVSGTKTLLSKFQKLILTLMRLRLNLTIQDLAYRFGISTSTTSSVFNEMLDILYVYLKPMVKWPSRE